MPLLVVHGVSDFYGLGEFEDSLINTVAYSVKELKLKPSDVSCFFPKGKMTRQGEEIIVLVECLTAKPDRTDEVRDRLANAIVQTVRHYFPDMNLIECFIKPFDPKQGFAAHKK